MTTDNKVLTTEEIEALPTPYTKEDMEKMLPDYMDLLDKRDEKVSLEYLKDNFSNRNEEMLVFAGMVATVLEERSKDLSPKVVSEDNTAKEVDHADTRVSDTAGAGESQGSLVGQDDSVEQVPPVGSDG